MARIALNKASLHHERDRLGTYRRFLPSLDLKRRQLMAEHAAIRRELAGLRSAAERLRAESAERLPMLAHEGIDPAGLVRIADVRLGEENRLGVLLPVLEEVSFAAIDYGMMTRPHWVDPAVAVVRRLAGLHVRAQVAARRAGLMARAVRRITQRVNLFEKVLIPEAQRNIARIQIHLADAERAAVVRAKIAKRKHAGGGGSGPDLPPDLPPDLAGEARP